MPQLALLAADLVAIVVLVALYVRRHRRRDLVVAYLTVNVGVLAVAAVLADTVIGAGLGLGLFGVLSIIRLRSAELAQEEVAYYFAALALGLLGGLGMTPAWVGVALMAMLLLAVAVGDSPRLLPRYRSQVLVLDTALTDEAALVAHLEGLLGARVHGASTQRVDLVNDTTTVQVRYRLPTGGRGSDGRGSGVPDAPPAERVAAPTPAQAATPTHAQAAR